MQKLTTRAPQIVFLSILWFTQTQLNSINAQVLALRMFRSQVLHTNAFQVVQILSTSFKTVQHACQVVHMDTLYKIILLNVFHHAAGPTPSM